MCPRSFLDYIEKILKRKGVKVKKGSYKSKTAQRRRDEGIYEAFVSKTPLLYYRTKKQIEEYQKTPAL